MGLDLVELVMELETAFDVELPERSLVQVNTVGELYQVVAERLYGTVPPAAPPTTDPAWPKLVSIIAASLGVPRERVTWEATLTGDLGAN